MSSNNNKSIFAENLKYHIERSGKSQKDLADMLGVASSTFNNWVMGNRYPRMDKVEMLANYFGIQKSDLIEERTTKEMEKSAINDGLTDEQRKLIDFARSLPEDKAALALRLLQSIVEAD